jgi:hypothetical protein
MKHPHVDRMFEYAEDALKSNTPWGLWQFRLEGGEWDNCREHPTWIEYFEYRRKPNQSELDIEAFNQWFVCSANGQHTYLSQAWLAALEWERSKK